MLYRKKVAALAERSDFTEIDVATEAISLAKQAQSQVNSDPRIVLRESHVGHYLVGDGRDLLAQRIGWRPNTLQRLRAWMWQHPDEFFLPGIAILTFLIVTGLLLFTTSRDSSLELILMSMLLFLLPTSQCAIQIIDSIITEILPAEIIPKLDFTKGLPADCLTLVAVPTLLLNEKQVHTLVEDLEVRFLGNHDANIHFALLVRSGRLRSSRQRRKSPDRAVFFADSRIEPEICRPQEGVILPASSPPHLQPARKGLDGLGAQARQVARPEQIPARRVRQLSDQSRRHFHPVESSFRDHARFRHGASSRRGSPHGRRVGPSAESGHHRSRKKSRGRRVRHTSAACRRQRAEHGTLAPRRDLCRTDRPRHLHARRLRCLSRPLRRRQFYRQGDL